MLGSLSTLNAYRYSLLCYWYARRLGMPPEGESMDSPADHPGLRVMPHIIVDVSVKMSTCVNAGRGLNITLWLSTSTCFFILPTATSSSAPLWNFATGVCPHTTYKITPSVGFRFRYTLYRTHIVSNTFYRSSTHTRAESTHTNAATPLDVCWAGRGLLARLWL